MANDQSKTKTQLIAELEEMRQQRSLEKTCECIHEEVLVMRYSDDLMTVVAVMFEEVQRLGIEVACPTVCFLNPQADQCFHYNGMQNPGQLGISWTSPDLVAYNEEIAAEVFRGSYREWLEDEAGQCWQQGTPWVERFFLDEEWIRPSTEALGFSRFPHEWLIREVTRVNVPFEHGLLKLAVWEDHPELMAVAQALTGALSLGYVRFLNLLRLEEQTESLQVQTTQLKRERAAERVRAAAMAMRSSGDLMDVAVVLYREIRDLGIRSIGVTVEFYLEETSDRFIAYSAYSNPKAYGISWNNPSIIEVADDVVTLVEDTSSLRVWQEVRRHRGHTEPWTHCLDRESWIAVFEQLLSLDRPLTDYDDPRFRELLDVPKWHITHVPFSSGNVAFREPEYVQEHVDAVQELAEALSLGYVRYLDFQRLEQQNREIQENTRRKSDFLSRMSHDLRTPMNAIIGYTRILLRRLRDSVEPRQLRNLENIETSSQNLLNLINEILDLSKVEAGHIDVRPQPIDIQQLAVECGAAIEPLIKAEVQLIQKIEAIPSLRTDGEILRKVLMNLLGNAVRFTDTGSITVSVKPVDDKVEVSVADTGMGIPSEDLPYIFEEFRQVERQGSTEKEGTGLGLAIAQKSIELLGGTIAAESEVGTGTTFTLRLKDYPSE